MNISPERKSLVLHLVFCLALIPQLLLHPVHAENARTSVLKPDLAIERLLDVAMDKHAMPGVIAAIVKSGKPLRIAAAGVREQGASTLLTIEDQVHLGSCTKAMTATVIARMIERGELKWSTTIGQGLPELFSQFHASYHDITLHELLTHHGGLESNAIDWWLDTGGSVTENREKILQDSLKVGSDVERGKYNYSNLGYMIAGLIAAEKAGKTWEALMQAELFDPLDIQQAGFGAPGSKDSLIQPRGHTYKDGSFNPVFHDNAAALGPAGTVHMSVPDWGKFLLQHMDANHSSFLANKSKALLHSPFAESNAAKGWFVYDRPWGKGKVLTHTGSNTYWAATVWVAPNTNTAYVVVSNTVYDKLWAAQDEIIGGLIRLSLQ